MFNYNELANDYNNIKAGAKRYVRPNARGLLLALLLLLLVACGGTEAAEESEPPVAVQNAQVWLAEQLGVEVAEVQIEQAEQVEWSDACFGLGGPAEICAAVITPGWQAMFEVNGDQYEVRFDEAGTLFRSPQLP